MLHKVVCVNLLSVLATDPATAEELGAIPDMGLAETKEAISAASKAFKTWSKTTAKVCYYSLEGVVDRADVAACHRNVMTC